MDKESLYTDIQNLFGRGIVTLIGSGASCARGLPSMGQLADHLIATLTKDALSPTDWSIWEPIATRLARGDGLEAALELPHVPDSLLDVIVKESGTHVAAAESAAINDLMNGTAKSVLGPLLQLLLATGDESDVITTNYDRLIEVDAALHEVPIDTMFHGKTIGRLDENLARQELIRSSPRRVRARSRNDLVLRPHIRLSKPHGSLDWRLLNGGVVRVDFATDAAFRIITPGSSKYREGYETPFDVQRDRANKAIDAATGFLAIGYGFNDPHLQTHLKTRFAQVPSLVLARNLTTSARSYLSMNNRAIGIECAPASGQSVAHQSGEQLNLNGDLWQIENLIREVLT